MAGLFIDERICDDRSIRPLVAQKRLDLIKECSAFSLKALFHYIGLSTEKL